jgi:hypothetical protein
MAGVKEEAVNFVVGYLSKDPDMPMKELQELGAKKGINVYPLIMGLAKNKLGLGRPDRGLTRKRSFSPRAARSAIGGVSRRGATVSSSRDPANMLNNFVVHMKQLEQENQMLRGTLQKIADLLSR